MARKAFLLRIDPQVLDALQRWADDDLRSLNGQIEFVLRRVLQQEGRLAEGTAAVDERRTMSETPSERGVTDSTRGQYGWDAPYMLVLPAVLIAFVLWQVTVTRTPVAVHRRRPGRALLRLRLAFVTPRQVRRLAADPRRPEAAWRRADPRRRLRPRRRAADGGRPPDDRARHRHRPVAHAGSVRQRDRSHAEERRRGRCRRIACASRRRT